MIVKHFTISTKKKEKERLSGMFVSVYHNDDSWHLKYYIWVLLGATLCDKCYKWLATGQWISLGTLCNIMW